MTYSELKSQLDELSPEQLDSNVVIHDTRIDKFIRVDSTYTTASEHEILGIGYFVIRLDDTP